MANYPSTLPEWRLPLTEKADKGFIRTQMDAGPEKVRRRYSAVSVKFTTSMIVDGTQKATLDTFFHTTLEEGADAFSRTDPDEGTTQSFRFLDTPSYRLITGASTQAERIYNVDLALEKLP